MIQAHSFTKFLVAPVRERGLKSVAAPTAHKSESRSRKGAWIEIQVVCWPMVKMGGRSRKGAWIEILKTKRDTKSYSSLP